ncbi:MAG: hypothetical protein ACI81V_000963 [Lentimonas sp.]|jgi:hypothetical protein
MHSLYKFLFISCCTSAALLSGCGRDESSDSLKVPRLMMEARGVDYGSLNGTVINLPVSGTPISLRKEPLINEFEILNVELVQVDLGLALMVQISETAARELYRASVTNNGSRVVLTVNGTAIGARRIDGAIADGRFYTFVELPHSELPQLVLDLKKTIADIQAKK